MVFIAVAAILVVIMMIIGITVSVSGSENEYDKRISDSTQILLESQGLSPADAEKLIAKKDDNRNFFAQGGRGPTETITLDSQLPATARVGA